MAGRNLHFRTVILSVVSTLSLFAIAREAFAQRTHDQPRQPSPVAMMPVQAGTDAHPAAATVSDWEAEPRDGSGCPSGPDSAQPAFHGRDRELGRISADLSGHASVLIFPKVELRWDMSENLIQDTFISLANDAYQAVDIQAYFVSETCTWVHNDFALTRNQPAYWSAATGRPGPDDNAVSSWLVLGSPYPDPEGSTDLIHRGYIVLWAINPAHEQIHWNYLTGHATVVDYENSRAWEYDACACRAVLGQDGDVVGIPGSIQLDGIEYTALPEQLLLDFYAVGATLSSGGLSATLSDTDLTLLIGEMDLRAASTGPFITEAGFEIWNENEVAFSGMELCFTKWSEMLLSTLGGYFLVENLGTDRAYARIDGLAAPDCYDSSDRPLVGLSARLLEHAGASHLAGLTLRGRGAEAAGILYDVSARRGCGNRKAAPDPVSQHVGAEALEPSQAQAARESAAGALRTTTGEQGSVIVYPKVEVRWDSGGTLVQDTSICLTNDGDSDVDVQVFLVSETGTNISNIVSLTHHEPTYWSAATGLPKGVDPWTTLGAPYADPDGSDELILRGYVIAWAVNAAGEEIHFNHLSGDAMVISYGLDTSWVYEARAFRALDQGGQVSPGEATGTPLYLQLDDVEFEACPDRLLMEFFASGGQAFSTGGRVVSHDTDLTLLIADTYLGEDTAGPYTTDAEFKIWNENEVPFPATELCFTKWRESPLSTIGGHFLVEQLQTDKGYAQIDGVESIVCPGSQDEALLGVAVKMLLFDGTEWALAGKPLRGYGTQSAMIWQGNDCNNNGVPDEDDIAGGASEDCNANEIPDECDIDPGDPDGNG